MGSPKPRVRLGTASRSRTGGPPRAADVQGQPAALRPSAHAGDPRRMCAGGRHRYRGSGPSLAQPRAPRPGRAPDLAGDDSFRRASRGGGHHTPAAGHRRDDGPIRPAGRRRRQDDRTAHSRCAPCNSAGGPGSSAGQAGGAGRTAQARSGIVPGSRCPSFAHPAEARGPKHSSNAPGRTERRGRGDGLERREAARVQTRSFVGSSHEDVEFTIGASSRRNVMNQRPSLSIDRSLQLGFRSIPS